MAFIEYFRKFMGWPPLKDSLRKGRNDDFFSEFKHENGNRLISSSTGLQEGRVLRTQVSLFPDIWDIPIIIFASIIVFMTWTGTYDPFMLLSVFYLCLIPFLLIKYRPGTVTVMPEKIIITRPLRKPVVIQREEIMQISVTENENYSWRWSFHIIFIGCLLLILFLALDRSGIIFQEPVMYVPLLLAYYGFKILKPYQCVFKIITRSNLRLWPRATLSLWLRTEESEEITRILKKRTNEEWKIK